jgi:hypothetical protein
VIVKAMHIGRVVWDGDDSGKWAQTGRDAVMISIHTIINYLHLFH